MGPNNAFQFFSHSINWSGTDLSCSYIYISVCVGGVWRSKYFENTECCVNCTKEERETVGIVGIRNSNECEINNEDWIN